MKVKISSELKNLYTKGHKNYNYCLNFLLSSLDLSVCSKAMELIKVFELQGEKVEVDIDDSIIDKFNRIFESDIDYQDYIEKLLWIAIFFPEV